MTWRELFRRAWLVLRLRFKRFLVCEECGDLLEITMTVGGSDGSRQPIWECPSCEAWRRLEQERQAKAYFSGLPLTAAREASLRAAAKKIVDLGLLQSSPPDVDPALLQNQIGAPIRLPSSNALGGSAIGNAIGGVLGGRFLS